MPNGKYQKNLSVPIDVFERVRQEVVEGREQSISSTFVKAVDLYLNRSTQENMQRELQELNQKVEQLLKKQKR